MATEASPYSSSSSSSRPDWQIEQMGFMTFGWGSVLQITWTL